MTYHTKSTGLASVAALAVGALLAFAPTKAEALTVTLNDVNSAATLTLTDGDANDGNTNAGVLSFNNIAFAGFTINNLSASIFTQPNQSRLSQTTLQATDGTGNAAFTVTTESSFSEGAGSPKGSRLRFTLAASSLGGTLEGHGAVGGSSNPVVNTPTLSFDPAIDGNAASGETFGSAVLTDPFDMMSVITVGATNGGLTNFTSSISATVVPLPASALLLLGGLGGLGGLSALRRRKRAA